MEVHFFPTNLFCGFTSFENTLYFPSLNLVLWLKNNELYKHVYYFWTFNSVPLIFLSDFMPIPQCHDEYNFLNKH